METILIVIMVVAVVGLSMALYAHTRTKHVSVKDLQQLGVRLDEFQKKFEYDRNSIYGTLGGLARKASCKPQPKRKKLNSVSRKTQDPEKVEFSVRLRNIRERSGISRLALSKKIGVTANYIWNWENSVCFPSPEYINDLAQALNVHPSYLLHGTQAKTASTNI